MANADKGHLHIPFKQLNEQRLLQQEFENYKAIERWANGYSVPSLQTFHYRGALAVAESDIWWVTRNDLSRFFVGGVTVYGSGTVTVVLKRNGAVVSTLSITGSGLFVADARVGWTQGDSMRTAITGTGAGCEGLVVDVLP